LVGTIEDVRSLRLIGKPGTIFTGDSYLSAEKDLNINTIGFPQP
jgi:hypothetical protein